MTDGEIELSRRKVLGSIGAVGIASAGLGAGTMALFNDTESFENNVLTAGKLDLRVHWFTDVDQGFATPQNDTDSGTVNGDSNYTYNVTDVKPGDSGTLAFCPEIVNNDAYLWIGSENGVIDYENGQTEPEAAVDPTGGNPGQGKGELSEVVLVTIHQAENVGIQGGEITYDVSHTISSGVPLSLVSLFLQHGWPVEDFKETQQTDATEPYPASSDPGQPDCIVFEWVVPEDVGNKIQSDSIELDLRFEAVQARHNPNPDNPFTNST